MDKISKALKCAECRQIIQSPVILPCGLSVCKHHTESKSKFFCMSCADEHTTPANGCFPSNKALEEMIAAEIQELDLGKEHKLALDLCNKLNETIEKLSNAYENPELYIHEKMSTLKNKVDLKRELLKLEIDAMADKMIEKIVKYEDECKTHTTSSSFKADFKEVDDKVKWAKADCKKWSANLNRLKVDVVDFENTSSKCQGLIGKLEQKFNEIESSLLLNKALTFEKEIGAFESFEIRFNFNNQLTFDFKFDNMNSIKEEKLERKSSILDDLNLARLGQIEQGGETAEYSSDDDDDLDEASAYTTLQNQLNSRQHRQPLSFNEFFTYRPPVNETKGNQCPIVGTYRSRGSANGRPVYRGPQGGLFYLNTSGAKQYVSHCQVEFNEA